MMQTTESNNNIEQNEISIKEIIGKVKEWYKYLLSKWLIIGSGILIGGLIGIFYASTQKYKYTAKFSFALEDSQSGGSTYAGIASQFGVDLGGTSAGGVFTGDNLLVLMKSRTMVEKALLTSVNIGGKEQTLAGLYITFNEFQESWKNKPELKDLSFRPGDDRSKFTLQQDSIIGEFHKSLISNNLSVEKLDKKLSIITVVVTSENELFSKYFTEILVKEVSDFYVETKTKRSVQNVAIMQQQADSVRRELNSAISGVAISADLNPNANSARQVLRAPSQRRTVDVQANQAIFSELVKTLEMSKITLRKETPLIQIIDKPILPLEKSKLGKRVAGMQGGFLGGIILIMYLVIRRLLQNL
jgi:hypothetical protein